MHFGLLNGDVSLGEVCGGGGGCNGVIFSRYGRLLGLPVSVWGMWYYVLAATLSTGAALLRREDGAAFVRATLWLTVAALAFDAWLAWAMLARVGRFCPLCAATYGLNVAIFIFTLRAAREARGLPGGPRSLLLGGAHFVRITTDSGQSPPTTARRSSSTSRPSARA